MSVTIFIKTIELAPGSHIRIHNLSWLDFEGILAELENERNTRASYYQQVLEVVSPLALHERPNRIIADIVKAILEFREAIRFPEIWIYKNDYICVYLLVENNHYIQYSDSLVFPGFSYYRKILNY